MSVALFQFPNNVQQQILESMDVLALTKMSRCSKKTFKTIKDLALKIQNVSIFFGTYLCAQFVFNDRTEDMIMIFSETIRRQRNLKLDEIQGEWLTVDVNPYGVHNEDLEEEEQDGVEEIDEGDNENENEHQEDVEAGEEADNEEVELEEGQEEFDEEFDDEEDIDEIEEDSEDEHEEFRKKNDTRFGSSVENLLVQMTSLFNIEKFDINIHFGQLFDRESIKKTLVNIKFVILNWSNPDDTMIDYLENYNEVKSWGLMKNPYAEKETNPDGVNKWLKQNYDALVVGEDFVLDFEQLLLINAVHPKISDHTITAKQLNTFLKLWVRGGSPRLEFLLLRLDEPIDPEVVLRGIKAKHEREFSKEKVLESGTMNVNGGYQVRSRDGRKLMSVTLDKFLYGDAAVEIVVWHS